MASIIEANAVIPRYDINNNPINFQPLITSVVPLTTDNTCLYVSCDRLDINGNSVGQVNTLTFFIPTANNTNALAAWNTFKSSLAVGTASYVTFTTNTLQ